MNLDQNLVIQVLGELHTLKNDPVMAANVCTAVRNAALGQSNSIDPQFFPLLLARFATLAVASVNSSVASTAAGVSAALLTSVARAQNLQCAADFLAHLADALMQLRTGLTLGGQKRKPISFLVNYEATYASHQTKPPRLSIVPARKSLANTIALIRATLAVDQYHKIADKNERALARNARTLWSSLPNQTRAILANAISHPAIIAGVAGAQIAHDATLLLCQFVHHIPLDVVTYHNIATRIAPALVAHRNAIHNLTPGRAKTVANLVQIISAVKPVCPRFWALFGVPAAVLAHPEVVEAAITIVRNGLVANSPSIALSALALPSNTPTSSDSDEHDLFEDLGDGEQNPTTLAEKIIYNAIANQIIQSDNTNNLAALHGVCFLTTTRAGLWPHSGSFTLWARLVYFVLDKVSDALENTLNFNGVCQLVAQVFILVRHVALSAPKIKPTTSSSDVSSGGSSFPFRQPVSIDQSKVWVRAAKTALDTLENALEQPVHIVDFDNAPDALRQAASLEQAEPALTYVAPGTLANSLFNMASRTVDKATDLLDKDNGHALCAKLLKCYPPVAQIAHSSSSQPQTRIHSFLEIADKHANQSPQLAQAALDAIGAAISIDAKLSVTLDGHQTCDSEIWRNSFQLLRTIIANPETNHDVCAAAAECLGKLAVYADSEHIEEAYRELLRCVWHPTATQARKNAFHAVELLVSTRTESSLLPILLHQELKSRIDRCNLNSDHVSTQPLINNNPEVLAFIASLDVDQSEYQKASSLALDCLLCGAVKELMAVERNLAQINPDSNSSTLLDRPNASLDAASSPEALKFYPQLLRLVNVFYEPRASLLRESEEKENFEPWLDVSLEGNNPPCHSFTITAFAYESELASYLGSRVKDWLPLSLERMLQDDHYFSILSALTMESPQSLWKKTARYALAPSLLNGKAWIVKDLAQRLDLSEKYLVDRVYADIIAGIALNGPSIMEDDTLDSNEVLKLIEQFMQMPIKQLLKFKANKILQRLALELGGANDSNAIDAITKLACRICELPDADTASAVGDFLSQHFLLVMDTVDQVLLDVHAEATQKIRYLGILEAVIKLANRFIGMYIHKVFSSLKVCLTDHEADIPVKEKTMKVWATLISSLGVEKVASHLGSMLATFLPYVREYSKLFVPALLELFRNGKEVLEPYFEIFRLVFRTVKHRSLNEIYTILEDAPTNVPVDGDVIMVDYEQSQSNELKTDLHRFSDRCKSLIDIATQHESQEIRRIALNQLLETLKANRCHYKLLLELLSNPVNKTNPVPILATLVTSLTALISEAKHGCDLHALQCLGELGAIDPALIVPHASGSIKQPASSVNRIHTVKFPVHDLAKYLLEDHLAPALWRTGPSDAAASRVNRVGLAIQELLKAVHCDKKTDEYARAIPHPIPPRERGNHGVGFWVDLNEATRTAAMPYLKEPFDPQKYESAFGTGKKQDMTAVFAPIWAKLRAEGRAIPLVEWRRQLVVQAIDFIGGNGHYGKLFSAVRPTLRVETGVVEAIFPYVIASAVYKEFEENDGQSSQFRMFLINELHHALIDEGSAVQCVFALMDTLRVWRCTRSERRGKQYYRKLEQSRSHSSSGSDSLAYCIEKAKIVDSLTEIIDVTGLAHEQLSLLRQARAALSARSYARVVFFSEQYVRILRDESGNQLWASSIPKLLRRAETSNSQAAEGYRREQEPLSLMQTAFAELEDADGVKSISALRSSSSLRQAITDAEAEGKYDDALLIYERAFREDKNNEQLQSGFLQCLCTLGHWETMLTHAVGLVAQNNSHSMALNLGIDAAWRLGRWDKLEELCEPEAINSNLCQKSSKPNGSIPQTQAVVGRSLLFVKQKKWDLVCESVRQGRGELLQYVAHAAVEGYARAYPLLVQAHALTDIEDLAELASKGEASQATRELTRIDCRTGAASSSLKVREPLLSLRRSCLEILGDAASAANVSIELAQIARENGNLRAATSAASLALAYATDNEDVAFASATEMARIQHASGDCAGALLRVKKLISEMANGSDASQGTPRRRKPKEPKLDYSARFRLCAAHVLAGQWTEEARSESSEVILSHFTYATEYCPKNDEAFYQLGRHYDSLWETAVNAESNSGTIEGRYSRVSQSQGSRLDRRASKMKRNHFEYVPLIIHNFTSALKNGHMRLYEALPRLLTVWFDFYTKHSKARNKDAHIHAAEPLVSDAITGAFKGVPLYMFMSVVPQLLSRISHPSKAVQDRVIDILAKLLVSFPGQGMWLIASSSQIRSSARKEQVQKVITKAVMLHKKAVKRSQASMNSADSGRRSDHSRLNKYIHNGVTIIKELIRICEKEGKGKRNREISLTEEIKSLRKQLEKCSLMVPNLRDLTITLPSERIHGTPAEKYNPFAAKPVTLADIEDDYLVMNSLMAPRRISFRGSDGKQYRFLAKRENQGDMRKDSRLMEFVTVVNRLLAKDSQTRARDLKLTTYAVIPLTEQTGIIEWLNDLAPLRSVLRDEMSRMGKPHEGSELQQVYERNSDKLRFLEYAFKKYPPVLDRWFVKTFAGGDARKWLDARMLWCRSVAAWSITGYIIGLGDRHAENLLLESTTGRAVHVDFAMLFDKGATLRVPEVVPFRLTPNIVAAFGIAGTEGPFRSACEIVLKVLRSNVDALMGIVEAFVHDPLFEPGKASDPTKTNAKVRDKLKGVVDTSGIPLSVQGQVQKLITDATSHERLAAMYIWWGAWM